MHHLKSGYGTDSDRHVQSAPGLIILGTEFGCGKTTLMCGLAGLLLQQGFSVVATKPVFIGNEAERNAESTFIARISRSPASTLSVVVEKGSSLTRKQWAQALKAVPLTADFTLIELPGGLATPLRYDEEPDGNGLCWNDGTDLAQQYACPCLIVAAHSEDAIEKLTLSASYARAKKLEVIGLATVETAPGLGRRFETMLSRDQVELSLRNVTGVPYLGCIKYSESVTVPGVNQGNLIKMTAGGIEFLTVLKELNLKVPRKD